MRIRPFITGLALSLEAAAAIILPVAAFASGERQELLDRIGLSLVIIGFTLCYLAYTQQSAEQARQRALAEQTALTAAFDHGRGNR